MTPIDRPSIEVQDAELHNLTSQAWDAIVSANDPPVIFVRGHELVRVGTDVNDDTAYVQRLDKDALSDRMSEVAMWRRTGPNAVSVVHPPERVTKILLSTRRHGVPVLERVARTPFYLPEGESVWEGGARLVTEAGYHADARVWYDPDPELRGINVGDQEDLHEAVRMIDDVLADFPFSGEGSKAHAIALMLLPFVRELIRGDVPMYLITAPTPGSGKGLLADVLLTPAERRIPRSVAASDEDEWRKRITSELMRGPSVILIDNLPPRPGLDSATMASVLTSGGLWADRILGKSEMVTLPVRAAFVATGNNVEVSGENSRRICRIHLDSGQEDPARRQDFRIPNLRIHVQKHRAELTWAALTMVQAWLDAQHVDAWDDYAAEYRPLAGTRMKQSYVEWSRVIGGILRHAGIGGFLEQDDVQENTELEELAAFFEAWEREIPHPEPADDISHKLGQMLNDVHRCRPTELLVPDNQLKKAFRYWLRRNKGRVAGGRRLVKVDGQPNRWMIRPA